MNTFTAGTQYNDFTGTIAADRSDTESFVKYLKGLGLAQEDDVMVGWRLGFTENSGNSIEPGIVAYLRAGTGKFEPAPREVRVVEVDIPTCEFFKFFKRFDMVFYSKGLDLSNSRLDGPHY